jgi:hypothetical protein
MNNQLQHEIGPHMMDKNSSEVSKKVTTSVLDSINIEDSISEKEDYENCRFFKRGSKYWTTIHKSKESYNIVLSNFVMDSLYHLVNGTNNSMRLILLQRFSGEKALIEVSSSELKLDQLKLIIAHQMDNEIQAITLPMLGWNEEHRIYVFADAVFTSDNQIIYANELGIVKEGSKCYYLPTACLAKVGNSDLEVERLYAFQSGKIDFKQWAEFTYKTSGSNAVIGILYLILAIYRDVVYNAVGFFPFMFLFGAKGTGKTSFIDKLLRLFGQDVTGTPMNNASIPGMSRQVSGRNNGAFYFKEYTSDTDNLTEALILSGYDGAGRVTATKTVDYKTKSYPVRSAIFFDGNYLPSRNQANFSRMIILIFEKTTYSAAEQAIYKEFEQLSKFGFGDVLLEILKLRAFIEDAFVSTFKNVSKAVASATSGQEERSINHTSLLITVITLLEHKLQFPFTIEEAKTVILENAIMHADQLVETGPLHKFWEAFAHYFNRLIRFDNSNAKVSHYNIKYLMDDEVILQIKFPQVWPTYTKYCKENNIQFLDSNSLKSLLTSTGNSNFIPSAQKSRSKSYTDKNFGSCYQFKVKRTSYGFEINGFEIYL